MHHCLILKRRAAGATPRPGPSSDKHKLYRMTFDLDIGIHFSQLTLGMECTWAGVMVSGYAYGGKYEPSLLLKSMLQDGP